MPVRTTATPSWPHCSSPSRHQTKPETPNPRKRGAPGGEDPPRVAICVLLPKGYRHCIRDLRHSFYEGCFTRGYLQMVQSLAPLNQAHNLTGFMNPTHVDYTTNQVSNSQFGGQHSYANDMATQNYDYNTLSQNSIMSAITPNQGATSPGYHPPSETETQMSILWYTYPMNDCIDGMPLETNMSSGYYPPAKTETQMNIPSNTYPMNDGMSYMPWQTNMLGGQHSHTDEMPAQNYDYNTLIGNSVMSAITPIQGATQWGPLGKRLDDDEMKEAMEKMRAVQLAARTPPSS